MSWTDERVELLKKMWIEGKSASQIAKELGSVTRNAVIGKVHRLGLSSRGPEGAPEAESPVAEPVAEAPEADPVAPAVTVAETAMPDAAVSDARPPAPAEDIEPLTAETPRESPRETEPARTPAGLTTLPGRRPVGVAGMPLPPQPSANEISPEALANVREVEKTARKLSLMELTERTCKWPIGDPATPDFWFCGLPTVAGKPYCEAHVSVAFQPMQARRDRRR